MATNFLDKTGLSYFWSKVKSYVDGKFLKKAGDQLTGDLILGTADQNIQTAKAIKSPDGSVSLKLIGNDGMSELSFGYMDNGAFVQIGYIRTSSAGVEICTENGDCGLSIGTGLSGMNLSMPDGCEIKFSGRGGINMAEVLDGVLVPPTPVNDSDAISFLYHFQSLPRQHTIELSSAAWTSNEQIVSNIEFLHDTVSEVFDNLTASYDVGIIATPSPTSMSVAASSGIYVSSYSIESGTITFACSSPPSSNVFYNVLTFPVVNSQ